MVGSYDQIEGRRRHVGADTLGAFRSCPRLGRTLGMDDQPLLRPRIVFGAV